MVAGLMIKHRAPDQKPESDDKDEAIYDCSKALIAAVKSEDVKAVSEALKNAFEILDSMPHVEGKHVSPHSYDAQNQKAGEE